MPAKREQPILDKREGGIAAETGQGKAENKSLAISGENLAGMLSAYIKRLESFTQSPSGEETQLPIDKIVLYLRVLQAMYQETIGRYEGTGADHRYVHKNRSEFAGELAYHPRFQDDARRMLRQSFEGAFRVLAEQFGGSMESPSSLEEMISIMTRLVKESSIHPKLRGIATAIINNPKTYGLDERDFVKANVAKDSLPVQGNTEENIATRQLPGGIKGLIGAITQRITGKKEEVSQSVGSPVRF